jgi:malonate transporter
VPVAVIFCFENMLHFIVTPTLMAMAGGGSERGWQLVLGIARRILLHPFILATAAGFGAAWFELSAPAALDRLLALLAGAAAPCALFAMGVTLALRPLKRLPAAIVPITLLKLVVHPLLCYAILTAIGGFSPIWVYSAVLLAALPSATNVYVLAQQYGVWVERGSASVLVTTVCSVVTVTALLYAINAGLLPTGPFG